MNSDRNEESMMMPTEPQSPLPRADLVPQRRRTWAWMITLGAAVLAVSLGYQGWAERGVVVSVELTDGHGLRAGDPVKHKGIAVGQVRSIGLSRDLQHVIVTAALNRESSALARAGARFWVVRPQLGATGVAGLETIVGPRFLAVEPGSGLPQRYFVGLPEPPVVDSIDPGDLEIVLQAPSRGGLRAGAPILYREIRVGTVLSVGLTSDGSAVEARIHIQKAYIQLIRPETRFWLVGGLEAQVGIRGVSIQMGSVESLLAGGIGLAVPPGASDIVRNGHRFPLEDKPDAEWLDWQPFVLIGSSYLPAGAPMPAPQSAVMGWQSGRWLKSERSRRGWVLQTDRGLLGPLDLLQAPEPADQEPAVLEVAGRTISLTTDLAWEDGRLGLRPAAVDPSQASWPTTRMRAVTVPEECIAVADPASTLVPVSASRLTPKAGVWRIDAALMLDESWHGASVLSRVDGALIGMILVDDGVASVALLPEHWPNG